VRFDAKEITNFDEWMFYMLNLFLKEFLM